MAVYVARLRTEYLENPLGTDETRPRLSWVLESERRGARQTAYQIIVASSQELLELDKGDLWDSGRVESDETTHIEYAGAPLVSRVECHWRVTVWDELEESTTSAPAHWSMGLLRPEDWRAHWISHDPEIIRRDAEAVEGTKKTPGSSPLFRKQFAVGSDVKRATLYATARGIIELQLNGRRVTEDRFLPEWTDYNRRLQYRTFDVTKHLQQGDNALGAMLSDGWWSGYIGWQENRGQYGTLVNSLLVQLEIELYDGQRVTIGSDNSWRCETGPILASDFMLGETYDARRERAGWDRPGFDDHNWLAAIEIEPPTIHVPKYGFSNNVPGDTQEPLPLVAQPSEPVRVIETIRPASVNEITPGVFIYDLAQNITGWVRLAVEGPAGTRLQIRHAERLNPDGTLYTENLRRATATDYYTLRGGGEEMWEPHFTFHGFQYIELTGLPRPLPLEKLVGCVVMSSTPPAGEFECDDPLVNRLWKNALWGQKGNFLSVPTDCPQRDERLGWMGDAQVFIRTATYNMDVAAFFTKWMRDVTDSQDVDGVFPDVAPRLREGDNFMGLDGLGGAAAWADAGVIVPWTLWQVYGDTRILDRHWDAMVRWVEWIERNNPNGIRSEGLGNNYGDWLCIPSDTTFRTHSPMKTLLATAFWADDAAKLAQMATVLGKSEDSRRFGAMHNRVREAFQREWLREDGRLAVETQTAYLLALAFDLLPPEVRKRSADHLVENIGDLDWHLSTGFVGIRHLNPILTLTGHADVAYRLLLNKDYPSWLYPVVHGATTIWERWNGWTAEDGFFNPQMNSFNHYSLGSVGEWLYRHVAGIELDRETPGYKRFVIRPHLGGGLNRAGARYESIHGAIESRWQRTANICSLEVTVPTNTTARIDVPAVEKSPIFESGGPAAQSEGLIDEGWHDGYQRFTAASGRYLFSTEV